MGPITLPWHLIYKRFVLQVGKITCFGPDSQMTVTWTSGYGISEAEPFVEWGPKGEEQKRSPAATLTFNRKSMCGE